MKDKITVTKKDILWNYIGMFLTMGMNYLLLPFMLYFLDEDILGLWYVFQNIGAISLLFDCGFSITFARNINYCWCGASELLKEKGVPNGSGEVDFHMLKTIIISSKVVYSFITIIAMILISILGSIYVNFLIVDINDGYIWVCWGIYILALFFNLYYGYLMSFLRGLGEIAKLNRITAAARVVQIIVTIVLFFLNCGLLSVCIGYLCFGVVLRMLAKHAFYKTESLKEGLAKITQKINRTEITKMVSTIWHNAWRDGSIQASDYLLNQIGTFLCSIYFTLSETGKYSLTVQLIVAVFRIAGVLHSNYVPVLQSAYITNDREKARKAQSLSLFSFIALYGLGTISLLVIIIPSIEWYKPDTTLSIPLILFVSLHYLILGFRNINTTYFATTNRVPYLRSFMLSSVLNVILSFVMLRYLHWGVAGLILAQLLSQIVYNAWKWFYIVLKELELRCVEMFWIGFVEFKRLFKKRGYES